MSRRLLPIALLVTSAAVAYACSDSSDPPATPDPVDEAGVPQEGGPIPVPEGGADAEAGPDTDAGENLAANPIDGVAAAKLLTDLAQFSDGPQVIGTSLYVALPFATNVTGGGPGLLVRMNLDGSSATEVRAGDGAASGPVGNSIDKQGNLISAERSKVTRTVVDGGVVTDIATTYMADGGAVPFDRPNDLVARVAGDGTIYVTDPAYGADNAGFTNNLIRIAPDGGATLVDTFTNVPRPNGIALSPDEKTLYVGFSRPLTGTKPFIRKYTVEAAGTLKDTGKLAELPTPTVAVAPGDPDPNDDPDGLAVDRGGNVYVAWKKGINVYKADGTRWGAEPSIAIAGQIPTGLTFGGPGLKTLFVTTQSGKIYTLTTKVTGIAQ